MVGEGWSGIRSIVGHGEFEVFVDFQIEESARKLGLRRRGDLRSRLSF